MFTGIVEEMGKIQNIKKGSHSAALQIAAREITADLHMGDSVAVNGVCLTVTDFSSNSFTADVMHETLNRTALADLKTGSPVNLERAIAANGRFGGHIVSGHVDGVGQITDITRDDNAIWYTIATQPEIMHYMVEKGSITIDGISLTVARVNEQSFAISAIPHTVAVTTLGGKNIGDRVNLENDIIGKYVEKFLQPADTAEKPATESKLTLEFLTENGF